MISSSTASPILQAKYHENVPIIGLRSHKGKSRSQNFPHAREQALVGSFFNRATLKQQKWLIQLRKPVRLVRKTNLTHGCKNCIERASNDDFKWPFYYSFSPRTVEEWNKLGTVSANSLQIFKKKLSIYKETDD